MIYSRIKYGSIVTGLTTKLNIDKIQTLHSELSILKVEDMIKQEILSFVYQYIHNKLPNVFNNYFLHRQILSEMIEEKRKRRFILPRVDTKIGENTIKYTGSKLFNNNELKLSCTIKTLKKHVKNTFLTYKDN